LLHPVECVLFNMLKNQHLVFSLFFGLKGLFCLRAWMSNVGCLNVSVVPPVSYIIMGLGKNMHVRECFACIAEQICLKHY